MKYFLVGYMGAGKSVIGHRLAESLGIEFIDLDLIIESRIGMTLSEFIRKNGELAFRKIERTTLLEIISSEKDVVLSCGGGTPVYYNNMDELLFSGSVIYLDVPIGELVKRLSVDRNHRPLLAGIHENELTEFIAKHLFERRPVYDRAQIKIRITGSIEDVVEQIKSAINDH